MPRPNEELLHEAVFNYRANTPCWDWPKDTYPYILRALQQAREEGAIAQRGFDANISRAAAVQSYPPHEHPERIAERIEKQDEIMQWVLEQEANDGATKTSG